MPSDGLGIHSGAALSVAGGALLTSDVLNHGSFNQTSGSLSISSTFVNTATANFAGGSQNWGPASVFVNTAGVATFSVPLASLFAEVKRLAQQGYAIDARVGTLAEGVEIAKKWAVI